MIQQLIADLIEEAGRNNEYDNRIRLSAATKALIDAIANEYNRGRATGRADVAKYSNAIGRIESILGYAGARPLAETVQAVATLRKERDSYKDALEDFADYDCHYGDNCPTFGSRHGRCVGCKARAALKDCY